MQMKPELRSCASKAEDTGDSNVKKRGWGGCFIGKWGRPGETEGSAGQNAHK